MSILKVYSVTLKLLGDYVTIKKLKGGPHWNIIGVMLTLQNIARNTLKYYRGCKH